MTVYLLRAAIATLRVHRALDFEQSMERVREGKPDLELVEVLMDGEELVVVAGLDTVLDSFLPPCPTRLKAKVVGEVSKPNQHPSLEDLLS
ncbi:MAG: hypothetical protein AAFS10_07140 [Myxococcota bacterium]